ncbi:MAG: DUF4837 family protein [Salinivirgaceae bacterium]|jgi:hypothetical protein|nr:DUF4837 family protein [Salinivirgaceae bacterium]
MEHLVRKLLFTMAVITVIVSQKSCLNDVTSASGGGREGEVVVVLDEKFQDSKAGNYIDTVLRAPFYGLPQYEPLFKLYVIPWNAFSNTFKSFRNIVKVRISSSVAENKVTVKRAGMQTVFHFKAKNESEFVKLLMKNKQQLVSLLNYSEKEYAKYKIKRGVDKNLRTKILNTHQIKTTFPDGYTMRLDTTNFVWLSYETNQLSSGIFIYYFDYEDSATFTKEYLLYKRDSLLKKYVQGPLADKKETYMTTEYNYIPPKFTELMVEKKYYTETRGLWTVVNDFMGGPFLQVAYLDQGRNRVVVFDGYVYHPSGNKRKYVRHLEAMAYMMELPKTAENGE